jgi:TRAP-type C4-dicarboxylate transport system substrate-binding protein
VYTPAYVITGKNHWEKLPADVREILISTAVGMQDFVYDQAEKLEVDLLEKMKGSVKINTADKQAFIDASGPVYEEFGTKVPGGAELIKMAQQLAK